jgi:hypothetical protein
MSYEELKNKQRKLEDILASVQRSIADLHGIVLSRRAELEQIEGELWKLEEQRHKEVIDDKWQYMPLSARKD